MTRPTDALDAKIDLERILAALPPQQRRAVRLYAKGYTKAEVARKMGVSSAAICQLFQRIVNKYG